MYFCEPYAFNCLLQIQLTDKILIYEPASNEPTDMHYRVHAKLIENIECQLLVVTTHNLVICQNNRLLSLSFQVRGDSSCVVRFTSSTNRLQFYNLIAS